MTIRTYTDLIQIPTFEDRVEYLRLPGVVGNDTFGFDRYLNQNFYRSSEWRKIRREVILRDSGCDLACRDHEILGGRILVHHLNPILPNDIIESSEFLMNPEYLVCVSEDTHRDIHYGWVNKNRPAAFVERTPNDMAPWKKGT